MLEYNTSIGVPYYKHWHSSEALYNINGNPILDLIYQSEDKLTPEETINLDVVAMHHMPSDVISGLAPI